MSSFGASGVARGTRRFGRERGSPVTPRRKQLLLWVALSLSTLAASFWAFWGIVENFHEGWYYPSLLRNLGLLLVQYLSPMILFIVAAIVGVHAPRAGAALHLLAAIAAAWFLRRAATTVVIPFIVGPLILMSIGYGLGRASSRRLAVAIVSGLPLLTLFIAGAAPASRVWHRLDDGDRSSRRVTQNGVDLVWAPAGPGWPSDGVTWQEAARRCRHLTDDGRSLSPREQNIWRLPTVEEAVRSMQLHGVNSGGTWNASARKASYESPPEKESPLWNPHSKVIYWWTSTPCGPDRICVVVYNGRVIDHRTDATRGYLGFRAVREPR